ncbi:ATP-dependent RNA helicase DDX19A [Trichinella sp. T8]|nr:ATP-dependent RNA helicase DDX19A [Trichinella sp. T8]
MRLCSKSLINVWHRTLSDIFASFVASDELLVPAVYCLCTGKDIGTYGYIFQALIDKAAVLEVDLNPDTIICDFETALIPAIRGYFPNTRVQGCYFHFCQAVHRKVGELGLKTRYRQHEETRRKIRMLLATAFLPVPHVNTGVSLLEAGTTGTLAALLQYFRQETNNHLEGWHNRLNRKACKGHDELYDLLQLLIAEQGVMDTLIQQVLSGNVTVGDLRRVNRVYAQKQRQVARYTGEYTNDRRTLEQFLEALMFLLQLLKYLALKISNYLTKGYRTGYVIVGTPGTVIRWLHQLKCFDLKKLSNFILDEADLMLNWGQRLFPLSKLREQIVNVYFSQRRIIMQTLVIGQCVIFCEIRSTAHWLVVKIRAKGHRVAVLSGEMIMEQRAEIVKRFRKGVDRILIATCLCSN